MASLKASLILMGLVGLGLVVASLVLDLLSQVEESKRFGPIISDNNGLSRVSTKGSWFVDESGRVIIFHGINAVQKQFPWIPDQSNPVDLGNRTQLLNLQKWGFNVVRLGVMWSGVMPSKHQVNETYLSEISKIVDLLASLGIYTLIDLHQDMMSSKFASYDGVPLWVLNEMPGSKFPFPWPLSNATLNVSLFAAYLTEPCGFAFQCLYDNVNRFQDYFQEYWAAVARRFYGNKAILGYELLNEPWAGDVYANPLLLLPGVAGHFNLLRLYDRTWKTIRSHDSQALIFYEPVTWGVLLNENYFGSGFLRPPGNDKHKTVFTWHYYCWLLQFSKNPLINDTFTRFDKVFCDEWQLEASFQSVQLDLSLLGSGPSFLSEFGVCSFLESDSTTLNTNECQAILHTCDKYLQSWTYWDSRFYQDNNNNKQIQWPIVSLFSRVYPTLTNGIPMLVHFNTSTKHFTFVFLANASRWEEAIQTTEIFVPDHVYLQGFQTTLEPSQFSWSFSKQTSRLLIYPNENILQQFKINKTFAFVQQCKLSLSPLI